MGKQIFADRAYIDKKMEEMQFALIDYFNHRFQAAQDDILDILGEQKGPVYIPPKMQEQLNNTPKEILEDEPEQPEWMIWKMEMSKKVGEVVKQYPKYYTNANDLLRKIYQKMNMVYGFVAEQERKRHKDPTGADVKRLSTLEVISYNHQYRSIFESILENMAEEAKIKTEKENAINTETLAKPRHELIAPLILARGDRSNYGCATYTMVLSRMKKCGMDIEAAKEAYKANNGIKRKVTNGELIDNDLEVKKRFIQAITEILMEIKEGGKE